MSSNQHHDKAIWPPVSPMQAGLKGACPRCGQGRLYKGMLTPAERCANCGLDYTFIDSGDGPAVFVILILGFLVLGLALAFDAALSPPIWVHVIIWIPVIVAASIWSLRFAKAYMIALQFQHSAREGELE